MIKVVSRENKKGNSKGKRKNSVLRDNKKSSIKKDSILILGLGRTKRS